MPKDTKPKQPKPRSESRMPSETFYCEQIRSALPEIASPIRPGELLCVWIERAARETGISAARLRAYWHRKVECPRIPEYVAVIAAANEAVRRQQAIAELEADISKRAAELANDHDRLTRSHPVLAWIAPAPAKAKTAGENAPRVAKRAGRRA